MSEDEYRKRWKEAVAEEASDRDGQQIALVHQLRHRVGTRHDCKCEECRAISRVCALAREAVAMKAAKRRKSEHPDARELAVDRSRSSPQAVESVALTPKASR